MTVTFDRWVVVLTTGVLDDIFKNKDRFVLLSAISEVIEIIQLK